MHICVKVMQFHRSHSASVVTAVTLMCTLSSQHCHYHFCYNAVLVFAAKALCSFSLSQRCAHSCLTAVEFLLCRESSYSKPCKRRSRAQTLSKFRLCSGVGEWGDYKRNGFAFGNRLITHKMLIKCFSCSTKLK